MKKLLFSLTLTCLLMSVTSCSDDFEGITYDLKSPDSTVFSPGDMATFELELSDDTGITEIVIQEPGLGINIKELYSPSVREIEYSFSVDIPEDQTIESQIGISVEITDEDANVLFNQIKISIEE